MYNARITLPAAYLESDIEKLGSALEDISSALSVFRTDNKDDGDWVLQWVLAEISDTDDLSARIKLMASVHNVSGFDNLNLTWDIEEIPSDIDWLEHSYQQFPPFSVGPFFIYGSHYDDGVPDGQMGLQIDAATAFGSGEHETTKGCLMAMLDLKGLGVCPWNVLDMGTGSGILAIAAWKLWKTQILAVDHDEESVRVSKHHQALNGVSDKNGAMICQVGDGFGSPIALKKKPYELIIANILAGPLIEMSIDIPPLIDDNGYIILSGILNEQADDVLSAYEALDLTLKKRYEMSEWTTLVLQNI